MSHESRNAGRTFVSDTYYVNCSLCVHCEQYTMPLLWHYYCHSISSSVQQKLFAGTECVSLVRNSTHISARVGM